LQLLQFSKAGFSATSDSIILIFEI
jgi:hypothetical protein